MSTLVQDILPIIDLGGAIIHDLGFCPFTVTMRVVSWPGTRPGLGTATFVDTALTLDGTHRPEVVELSSRDILASGGKYAEGDYRVGPFTPAYPGGGRDPSYFDPPTTGSPQEIFYKLVGAGVSGWFKKVDQKTDDVFGYTLVIRAAGVDAPGGAP